MEQEKNNKKMFVVGLVIICLIIVIGLSMTLINKRQTNQANQQNNTNNQINADEQYQVKPVRPIDETDHLWGDKNAVVQLIIYDDFECPFCAEFYDTLEKVKAEFGDKVAIAYRHYPLAMHPNAMAAAAASECAAEQGQFWEMYSKLFAENKFGRMSPEQFKADAKDLGLDQVKFSQCLDTEKYKDKILEQMLEGTNAGVTGTPTIFANNQIYPGAYPFDDFIARDGRSEKGVKSIISELLKWIMKNELGIKENLKSEIQNQKFSGGIA